MVPATLAVGLLSGCCQVGCQAAVRCCQIVKHCQALSGAVSALAVNQASRLSSRPPGSNWPIQSAVTTAPECSDQALFLGGEAVGEP
jgi:hypothetical protein